MRVLKKEKIIVVGVSLTAATCASVYSFLLPDEYLMEAKLSYVPDKEILISDAADMLKFRTLMYSASSLPTISDAVDMLKSQYIIQEIASQEGEASQKSVQSILGTLKVENIKNTDRILIQLR